MASISAPARIVTLVFSPDRSTTCASIDSTPTAPSVGPVTSVYRWKGRVEETEEWPCLLKTRADLAERLAAFLRERHPYEVPEIVVLPIERATEAYGDWIDDETTD